MLTLLAVLTALSLLLHIPAVADRIKASKTKADDMLLEGVDMAKDALESR
jgi:hypothetical protein